MDINTLHSIGYSLYILVLFIGIGVLVWMATLTLQLKQKQYGTVFAFLILFPSFIPNLMWDTWQIHLFFPLIYLLFIYASGQKIISNFYPPVRLRYDNPALSLGAFFVYAFASTAWAYFPIQSFMMTLLQFISIGFVYLTFRRIQHTRAEIFANYGEPARFFLIVGIGSFMLLLLFSNIVPEIYSIAISLFEENIKDLLEDQIISGYFALLTGLFSHRTFFDSGFTFFAVLVFPLAMLMPSRNASLFLLGSIFLAILLISNSQASIISLFCGICVVLFLHKLPKWLQQITPWVMLVVITFLPFFTILLLSIIPEFFNLAFVRESGFFIASLGPRLWIYENAIFLDIWMCPWFGCGIGSTILDAHNSVSIFNMLFASSVYYHPHNHTLMLLVELGIVGLLLFLWVCVCVLRSIQTLNEQYRSYALGAFFSALCITAFTQPLWGIGIIIWCVVFLIFAFFGRYTPATPHQKDIASSIETNLQSPNNKN